MRSVSKRELNQNTAAVLAEAAASDGLVVTERGRPRWYLGAYRDGGSTLARWEREGLYAPPAAAPAAWPESIEGPSYTSEQVDDLMDELRGDH